jgi:hypothetical protein
MWPILVLPVAVQALAMAIDEGIFHRRRRLGRWERVGHPLDTLTVLACYAWLFLVPPSAHAVLVYVALAIFSCAFVTKDESIHARVCTAGEHWIHAVLFMLHPIVLASIAVLWPSAHPLRAAAPSWLGSDDRASFALGTCAAITATFGLFQAVYWNVPWQMIRTTHTPR